MKITPNHVEWAVVDRLQEMLRASRHPQFNVTQTYALFAATLCWIAQRIRPDGVESETDASTQGLYEELGRESAGDPPWSIEIRSILPDKNAQPHKNPQPRVLYLTSCDNLGGLSADQLVISLRDAVAHGDGRKVRPFHRRYGQKPDQELMGFLINCQETRAQRKKNIRWSGTVTLLEQDMREIGHELGERFCNALGRDGRFVEEARLHVVERAA